MIPDPDSATKGLLEAVAEALSRLLEPGDWDRNRYDALGLIGEAAGVDRVYVFENHSPPDGNHVVMCQRYEWVRSGIPPQIGNPKLQNLSYFAFPGMLESLRAGRPFQKVARDFTSGEIAILQPQDILSLVVVPITLGGDLWGFLGMDDCHNERNWSEQELQALRAAAAGIGGSVVRRQAEEAITAKAAELKRHRNVALSLMEDARRSEQSAAHASRAKTTFLAMMSHEIRTPLNGVIGFTELLLDEGLPNRQSQIALAIRTCGETLLSLISDILDISKIESGRLDLEPTDGSVEDCMRSVATSFDQAATRSGIEIIVEVDSSCPRRLRLDFKRLRQILFNLVGNAVKFTAEGRVTLRAWVERQPSGAMRLHGTVRDTGAGIAEHELPLIFEPFEQGDSARSQIAGGSGLGLAICRRLLDAMGGGISVESRRGQGSEFLFHLLVQEAGPEPLPEDHPEVGRPAPEASGEVRVLAVDDVRMNLQLVASLLGRLGYSVDSAPGGREAVQMASEAPYDLIFMDILMPEMDGFESVRRIRKLDENGAAKRPWIVALTADALLENRRKCAEVGMDDFITKPLRIKDIEECLSRWKAGVLRLAPRQ